MTRLWRFPDLGLTPSELAALEEAVRVKLAALEAEARAAGTMSDEAYRLQDVLAEAQVKLRLAASGRI